VASFLTHDRKVLAVILLLYLTVVNILVSNTVYKLRAPLNVWWLLTVYALVLAVLVITAGDPIRTCTVFGCGIALFTTASAASGCAL
jgi:hypothetical protein